MERNKTQTPDLPRRMRRERLQILRRLERWLEVPMLVLGGVWLLLLVIELAGRFTPILQSLGTGIWVVFIVDFALKLVLAPRRVAYIRKNWLTALALLVPALRVFRLARLVRVLRAARAARGLSFFRLVASVNRGMGALGSSFGRRGFGYVLVLTIAVTVAGAAGMYAFERDRPGGGLDSYGQSLWWTAMLLTSLGSEYWPRTPEGRLLCFLLALYGFAVFGYVTATLATFFIGRDAESSEGEVAGGKALADLSAEISALRDEVRALYREISPPSDDTA